MTDAQGLPSKFQPQGPANNCVIDGKQLGWSSCTGYAMAMATDQGSANRVVKTGCDFRKSTHDTTGGTTLPQNAPYAEANGVSVAVRVGSNTLSPEAAWNMLWEGRGIVVQGNTKALLNTTHRSTGTAVNHAVFASRVRVNAGKREVAVYDPAADGRKAGWGTADQGPSWWPWERLLAFAAALKPWGENDSRVLGPGKWYCAVFPDTNPHAHYKYGGTKSSPFPDRTRINRTAGQWAYKSPYYGTANRVRRYSDDDLFVGYQYSTKDGRKWVGNHDGTEWIPAGNLRHVGGTT